MQFELTPLLIVEVFAILFLTARPVTLGGSAGDVKVWGIDMLPFFGVPVFLWGQGATILGIAVPPASGLLVTVVGIGIIAVWVVARVVAFSRGRPDPDETKHPAHKPHKKKAD